MTKVIYKLQCGEFREEDEPVAFFPDEPFDQSLYTCMCYQHLGQHGPACVQYAAGLRPATPEQYQRLHWELTKIVGYTDLKVVKRFTQKSQEIRKQKLEQWK